MSCISPLRHLILLLFVVACGANSGLTVAQRQREQPQANQQVAASPAPTPSPQPTVEVRESQVARNEADRAHNITVVDERSPWPVWIANFISALLFLLVAYQAVISRGMLRSMKDNEEVLKSQSVALTKQAEVLEKSFRVNTRAYVFISEATLADTISSSEYPKPRVILKNSGKTPAYRYRVRFEHGFLSGEDDEKARKGIMPPMRSLAENGRAFGSEEFSTIHPLKQTWKNVEEREAAMRGLSTYHIWGLICYADIFDEDHSYKFSLYAQHPNTNSLSYGAFGNDTEDKPPQS